jgi:hypothetical protein
VRPTAAKSICKRIGLVGCGGVMVGKGWERGAYGFQVRFLEADVEEPEIFVKLDLGRHFVDLQSWEDILNV